MWLDKVPTAHNIADLGTKQVGPIASFEWLRDIANGKTTDLYLGLTAKDILNGKYGDGA